MGHEYGRRPLDRTSGAIAGQRANGASEGTTKSRYEGLGAKGPKRGKRGRLVRARRQSGIRSAGEQERETRRRAHR